MSASWAVPAPDPACRLTVTLPARNEERHVLRALNALARQLGTTNFDVLLFANNCSDATAALARRFAEATPFLRLHVIEATLPAGMDHVGYARRLLLDCAAERFLAIGHPFGIIASTDADTVVAPDWVVRTVDEIDRADAVAGLVEIDPDERRAMPEGVRRLYAAENEFRRAWAEVEALIDPRPEDPHPRHASFVAASFAVTADAYVRAGRLPAVPALEDRHFARALRRIDARVRHSPRVRAWTSGRRVGRTAGGFGTLVDHLYRQAEANAPFMVENPAEILDELEIRAALRRLWNGERHDADAALLQELLGVGQRECLEAFDRTRPFGSNVEFALNRASKRRRAYPLVPVEDATAVLRAAAAWRKAASATRSMAASGAG